MRWSYCSLYNERRFTVYRIRINKRKGGSNDEKSKNWAAEVWTKNQTGINSRARENQLIALAIDRAEQQLLDGTASSQVITHYLKLGSTKDRLEREKLERENELLKAKTESIQSMQRIEELYKNALDAMRNYTYSGDSEYEEEW